ncbi:ankyrin repeat protein, putative [Trichomonas vaginalis G3]|uniref:Ankyrin repeat protein, putative n=1 Tax=Trichomonas vaginalis (strain ATCC PRA-98 / G3) TaxID=412133 RepID=A2DPV3_TRIV3|nr:ankyrin repeat and SOCS box-containing protein 4 family [Trichomonas vaginalis G3]EAY17549.1 ankyrin repeat protein, putative [Trichomonas vaginalis G3]KAI5520593.1 ankyrin repeat and SOCS box-containing protein 4 family [Trichomonas vaginalis G3]|eukprot:XP_001329684.1 ankyrin repeat protein [Trichomonas vaginalis G3]
MIIEAVQMAAAFNNKYFRSYLKIFKKVYEEYHPAIYTPPSPAMLYFLYMDYGVLAFGITLQTIQKLELKGFVLDVHPENTIYRAIMNDDIQSFIAFTERAGFDENQRFYNDFYEYSSRGYTLLELCCYHGAVNCFKLLRTKFNSIISEKCLQMSFLGGNQEIMSECMKQVKPNKECMRYAIMSHNNDFVSFLAEECNIEIVANECYLFYNLQALFILLDRTKDIGSCLVKSAYFNIPSLCEYFLQHGANVNAMESDKFGMTAIHVATQFFNFETANFLLANGSDINIKSKIGLNPLHIAAGKCGKEVLEFLISHGSDIKAKTREGNLAIHMAAISNQVKNTEYFLDHGFDINERNNEGVTPLHIAVKYHSNDVADFLIQRGANINSKDLFDGTPLHFAARCKNREMVEVLVLLGADINARDNHQRTPLHCAGESTDTGAAEVLIAQGSDINAIDDVGFTVLHYAAEINCVKTAIFFISHGANVDAMAFANETPLIVAAAKNSTRVAEILILNGANINHKGIYGDNALHICAKYGSLNVAAILVKHGIDIKAKNFGGITPLEVAQRSRNFGMVIYLNMLYKAYGNLPNI